MIKRAVIVPALLVASLALAGCSGSDETGENSNDGGGGDAASVTPSPTGTSTNTISPPLPQAPVLKDGEGAAEDLTFDTTACGLDEGRQRVSGSITNSTRKAADYVIQISWISAEGGNTLGRAVATVRDAKPGRKTPFTASATILAGADQCVPNVLRGTLSRR